jgi:hypothetical protein
MGSASDRDGFFAMIQTLREILVAGGGGGGGGLQRTRGGGKKGK